MKNFTKNFLSVVKIAVIVLALSFNNTANASNEASTSLTNTIGLTTAVMSTNLVTTVPAWGWSWGWSWSWGNNRSKCNKCYSRSCKRKNRCRKKKKKDPKQSIPLDGGLSFLVLGAAALGARKLYNNKSEQN